MQDVRSKNSQSTFDLGGTYSNIVKGLHLFNTYDDDDNLIAVNVRSCASVPIMQKIPSVIFYAFRKSVVIDLLDANIKLAAIPNIALSFECSCWCASSPHLS